MRVTRSTFTMLIVLSLALLPLIAISGCAGGPPATADSGAAAPPAPSEPPPEIVQQTMPKPPTLDSADYDVFNRVRTDGPIIPGIFQSAVPQGMAYDAQRDVLLISSYMFDDRPSSIAVISMADATLQKVLWLEEPDGTPHMGHVGGLAVSGSHLWIASGPGVYYVDRAALDGPGPLRMTAFLKTAAKGSFATYAEGILWVGEFTSRDGSYSTPKSHTVDTPSGERYSAWMAGFVLDPETDLIGSDHERSGVFRPDLILSVPYEVQGAVIHGDYVVLSQSYGRRNNSRISIYGNPLAREPFTHAQVEGTSVPVWVLDRTDLIEVITAPPMTEGVADLNGALAVLFESGSDKYRSTAKDPLDRVQILHLVR